MGAELFQCHAAGTELVAISRIDVAIPELLAKSESRGQIEDHDRCRAGLPGGRHNSGPELNEGLCGLT